MQHGPCVLKNAVYHITEDHMVRDTDHTPSTARRASYEVLIRTVHGLETQSCVIKGEPCLKEDIRLQNNTR